MFIFSRPTPAGVKWLDAVTLFKALGADISEAEGSRVSIVLLAHPSFLWVFFEFFRRGDPSFDTLRYSGQSEGPGFALLRTNGYSLNFHKNPFVLSRALARIEGSPQQGKLKEFKSTHTKV